MPPGKIRLIWLALICIASAGSAANAQSNLQELFAQSAEETETITFRVEDYDVISSIYVFLTSGDEREHRLVLSLESVEASGGANAPLPCSLDSIFRSAILKACSDGLLGSICDPDNNGPIFIQIETYIENNSNGPPLSSLPVEADQKVWTYKISCIGPNSDPQILVTHAGYRDIPDTW